MGKTHIPIPREKIAEFCKRNHIRRLALFGSVLREDFRSDSDVDILVEFEKLHIQGFFKLAHMERVCQGHIPYFLTGQQVGG
jgi:predicted nucleotidyltransferase